MSKKRTPFVIDKNDDLYVLVEAVMSPLVVLMDGLSVTFFGKSKRAYIKIDTAIDWCQKESAFHSADKYDEMITVMERVKAGDGVEVRE